MYNILLLYGHLHSYIMIHTNELFITYWPTCMCTHLYSEQYFYTSSMDHLLYMYKGNVQRRRVFYSVHPWVYHCYFDFG